jgi:hypothetical protein
MATDLLDRVAEILAVLMTTPARDRLDALAVAVRAALDSGVVRYEPEGAPDGQP